MLVGWLLFLSGMLMFMPAEGERDHRPPGAAAKHHDESRSSQPMALRALVRGVGDIGSAVAHRLFLAGYAVAVHDGEQPTTTRRRMAFADAIFDGRTTLDGVEAIRVDASDAVSGMHRMWLAVAHVYALTVCLLLVGLVMPPSCWAYRPFVSTDAAVADPQEVEIELGYFTLERDKGENSFIIPRVVLNYGLFKNWEAVGEFAVLRSPDGDVNLIDSALSVKAVVKEGVLQETKGISIAVEVGLLLPSTEQGERHFGFEGTGIASAKLGAVMLHVNGGLGVQRSNGDVIGIWGVIGELPLSSGLRLVGEVNGEKPRHEDQRDSGLLGVIWQPWPSKNVSFDAGVRRGFTSAAPDWQVTMGVTFGFSVSSLAARSASLAGLHQAWSIGSWK